MTSASEPRIAIIIPVYRHSVLVVEAIESSLLQAADIPVCVVVVNDGCPFAETDAVCRDYAATHPGRLVYLKKPNGGLADARNFGIRFVLSDVPSAEAIYMLDADNRLRPGAMARAMADVRSSSAVLAELQRLVPESISLDQARINGDALDLSGEALMPDGLRTLNALILSLGQSELFELNGVKLQQATLQRSGATEAADSGRLSYEMSAAFVPDASKAIRPRLAALGAVGLERRLRRLRQETGLLE